MMVPQKFTKNGVDVFDDDCGGILIETPQPIQLQQLPYRNWYDRLHENVSINPEEFYRFILPMIL